MSELIQVLAGAGLAAFLIFIGFLMGFKAARPEENLITNDFDPGPTDEPEGDIFNDALINHKEKGVSTL